VETARRLRNHSAFVSDNLRSYFNCRRRIEGLLNTRQPSTINTNQMVKSQKFVHDKERGKDNFTTNGEACRNFILQIVECQGKRNSRSVE